jgi:hypothetical protein
MALFDAHLKAATEQQKMQHAQAQREMDVAEVALGMVSAAASHVAKMLQRNVKDKTDV